MDINTLLLGSEPVTFDQIDQCMRLSEQMEAYKKRHLQEEAQHTAEAADEILSDDVPFFIWDSDEEDSDKALLAPYNASVVTPAEPSKHNDAPPKQKENSIASRLSDKISYPEMTSLDKADKGHEASCYIIEVGKHEIQIALGKLNHQHKTDGVIYCPIYMVLDGGKTEPIGIYEFSAHNLPNILDEDGDLDIDKLEPLLYKFVTVSYLAKAQGALSPSSIPATAPLAEEEPEILEWEDYMAQEEATSEFDHLGLQY